MAELERIKQSNVELKIEEVIDIDLKTIERILVSERYLKFFNVQKVYENEKEMIIEFVEKEDLIPFEIEHKKVVLNGYKNRIEIMDSPVRQKLLFLHFYRRKWKEPSGNKSYYNSYTLHDSGMKATKELGYFLKEHTGREHYNSERAIKDFMLGQ
jgi:hypothetical protein